MAGGFSRIWGQLRDVRAMNWNIKDRVRLNGVCSDFRMGYQEGLLAEGP